MNTQTVIVTGAAGLIGRPLFVALQTAGCSVRGLDLLPAPGSSFGDVRDPDALARSLEACDGIVHLAAVSRVVWAERDPALCRSTNVGGTRAVVEAALASPRRPWVLFASSREVYGEPDHLPVSEDVPLRPVNVYGEAKVAGERLVLEAREHGLCTAVVRLSNVYGSTTDHADRVVPAFARAAAEGTQLRVDGREHTFDFTHLDDTVRGLLLLAEALAAGEPRLPPIHQLTRLPTTLGELAQRAVRLGGGRSRIVEAPSRSYDVARFCGDPTRARQLLGWEASVRLEDGLARLVEDFGARTTEAPTTRGVSP